MRPTSFVESTDGRWVLMNWITEDGTRRSETLKNTAPRLWIHTATDGTQRELGTQEAWNLRQSWRKTNEEATP